jgi:hypothetical protein
MRISPTLKVEPMDFFLRLVAARGTGRGGLSLGIPVLPPAVLPNGVDSVYQS